MAREIMKYFSLLMNFMPGIKIIFTFSRYSGISF